MPLSCLSFLLRGHILFCFSLSLVFCLCLYPFLSLPFFRGWESCSPSVSLPCLLACSTSSKENISLTYPSCSIFVSLSCLSSTLQMNLRAFSFSTPSLFCLLFLILRLCSTLPGDTTTDYRMCSTVSVEAAYICRSTLPVDIPTDCPCCSLRHDSNRLSAVLSLTLLQSTFSCALLCLAILQPTLFCTLPADIRTDYLSLYSACPCYSWLSTLPTIRSTISGGTPTDYPIYRLSTLLSQALLQPTMTNESFQ
jgi:hypothetical protein